MQGGLTSPGGRPAEGGWPSKAVAEDSAKKARCAKEPRAGFGLVLPLPACHSVKCTLGARATREEEEEEARTTTGRLRACDRRRRGRVLWRSRCCPAPAEEEGGSSEEGKPTASRCTSQIQVNRRLRPEESPLPTIREVRMNPPHLLLTHPASSPVVCTLLRQLHYVTSLMHLVPSSACFAVCCRGTEVTMRADPSFL
ncbi:hypothetical protein MTO96_021416 [Rhipicephalus appendiculatus]